MKLLLGALPLLAIGLQLAACSTVLCEDDECCEGEACVPPPPPSDGVAVPWEAFDGSRGPAAPGTLVLKLTNGEGFCQSPWLDGIDCSGGWEADIPLPPSAQFAGAIVNLADLGDLGGGATFRDSGPGEGDSCQLDEGSLTGQLEIVSISPTDVTVRLSGASPSLDGFEEELTLTRCQNPELPQQAVVLRAQQVAALYPNRDTAGFPEDGLQEDPAPPEPPEPLHVFIDLTDPSIGAVCEDPLGVLGGCDVDRLTLEIVIGVDHQFPGGSELSPIDEAGQGMEVSVLRASAGDVCLSEAEGWTAGSVEIIAITPSLVQVRAIDAEGAVVEAVATRCF